MVDANSQGHRTITMNKRWEDFTSLKQHYSDRTIKQIDFASSQLTTATFAVIDGAHVLPTLPAAEGHVFLSTAVDDANQDLASVWVVYQDDTGAIHGPYEHLLNDNADTTVEAPLFNEDAIDTIAAGQGGKAITMTALNPGLNAYAGKYMVAMDGEGVGEAGNLIVSNTADNPTVLTVTNNSHASANGDNVSIQTYPGDDFYRVREMYCDVEVLDTKEIRLGDKDSSNLYGHIGVGQTHMVNSGFFTQPSSVCKSYLGRIKASFPYDFTATKNGGAAVQVFYTPKAANTNITAVQAEIEIPFANEFTWEPCIELEPATDVIIKVKKINDTLHDEIYVEASYLEVYAHESAPAS